MGLMMIWINEESAGCNFLEDRRIVAMANSFLEENMRVFRESWYGHFVECWYVKSIISVNFIDHSYIPMNLQQQKGSIYKIII